MALVVWLAMLASKLYFSRASYDHVVELTSDNFEPLVQQDPANGLWFIKLYAPWCGHCKALAPILDKVAPFMKGKMAFGKIDCTVEKALCKEKFQVKGYPTLKIYRDGAFFDYPGERHADAIITFGEKMSENPVQVVEDLDHAIDKIAKHSKDKIVFVAYDPDAPNDHTLETTLLSTQRLQVFSQVARIQQAFASFGYIPSNIGLTKLSQFGVENKAFLAKIERGADPVLYQGEMTSPNFLDFVKANNHALVTELGGHNFRQMGQLGKLLAIAVVNPDDAVKSNKFVDEIKSYAKAASHAILDKYLFCTMDGKKFEKFLTQFKIMKANLPEIFVLQYEGKEFWQDSSVFTVDEFIKSIENGEITKQKAEEPQTKNPFMQVWGMFTDFMPYSALLMATVFLITYIAFLPEEKWQKYFGKGHSKEDEKSIEFDKKKIN